MKMTVAENMVPYGTPRRDVLGLLNLQLRKKPYKISVVKVGEDPRDPPIYVIMQVLWRDSNRGLLSQLPRVLSYLEVMRGTGGVPSKVSLEGTDGFQLYIRTDHYVSDIPPETRKAVQFLWDEIQYHVTFTNETSKEVEEVFWNIARKNGFSPAIVDKMEEQTKGFGSAANLERYQILLQRYFSLKFRIHTAESILHVEDDAEADM
jgi:hypothetical protein